MESLKTLKDVFLSTRKMKFFTIWFIVAIFFQFLMISASSDHFQFNKQLFFVNVIISTIIKKGISNMVILKSFIFAHEFVKEQTNQLVIFISILCSGLSTLIFWIFRNRVTETIQKWEIRPSIKFVLFGSLGAIWVEFIFWLFEKLFNTAGVAASPNLILDWLVTIPWYIMMVSLVWVMQKRYHYTLVELALLGGFYEFISPDGVMGLIFKGQLAFFPLLLTMIPMYCLVYSYMILPPTILNRKEIEMINSVHLDRRNKRRFIYGLIPLLGLIPYAFILPLMV